MIIDRDSAVITDVIIDDKECSYSLEIVEDIETALSLRSQWNTIYKPLKKELLKLNHELGDILMTSSADDNVILVANIKKKIKELKKQKKSLELEHSDLLVMKKIVNNSRKKMYFSFGLNLLKDNCVCCSEPLPETLEEKCFHRIKYGNYCKKCG